MLKVRHLDQHGSTWVGLRKLSLVRGQGECARDARTRGGRGHAGGEKSYVGVCAKLLRSMIYCANLRPYPRAPVWFLVPQGIREERYADNVVMQRCDRDCDPGVDPYTYV